jgi:hypothetical protein
MRVSIRSFLMQKVVGRLSSQISRITKGKRLDKTLHTYVQFVHITYNHASINAHTCIKG